MNTEISKEGPSGSSDLTVESVKVRLVEGVGTQGLLAWASCVVSGAIKLDNIAIRRGKDGSLFLTYPTKRTPGGDRYPYFNPISTEASKAVEDAVLTRLAVLARPHSDGGAQAP